MSRSFTLFTIIFFFIATEVSAQNKELRGKAKLLDSNGDGLVQRNEAKGRLHLILI
jgi:hypothetical protein